MESKEIDKYIGGYLHAMSHFHSIEPAMESKEQFPSLSVVRILLYLGLGDFDT